MKKIVLEMNGQTFAGEMNETVAAKEFQKRLPFTASCKKADGEYYCSSASGMFDPEDIQIGWKAGDICQWQGWFSICTEDSEMSSPGDRTIVIGRIDGWHEQECMPDIINITLREA